MSLAPSFVDGVGRSRVRCRRFMLAFAVCAGWTVSSPAHGAPTEPGTLVNPLEDAQECRYCHANANANADAQDPLYSAFFGWQGTMMANAALDPVFWGAVALAAQDEPTETEDCIRCHSPRAFLEGRGDATTPADLTEADLNGVDCEVCHRMLEDAGTPRGNARYEIDDTLVGPAVARRGPWDYTDGVTPPDPDQFHPVAADPFTGSSELCGTCHDVTTGRDRLDDDGNSMGVPFNEQRTYSEWLGSAFAQTGEDFQSCQGCHMPPVDDKPGCDDYVDVESHPTGGRRHELVGANRFMMGLIRDNFGANIGEFYWDIEIERLDAFLPTSATLAVTGPATVDLTEGLSGIDVTVTNETGHKLPTGYSEGRVMWLEVEADYGEETVWTSGAWDGSNGTFEQDDQLRTYEALAENFANGTRNHLLQNNHWIVDTRIPPRGLQPDPQTDPVGDRYALQNDGAWPHWDDHTYAFSGRNDIVDATPGDDTDDVLTVTVRLRYLINTPEYIDQLVEDNMTNSAGDDVATMFEDAGGVVPVVLGEEQVLTIPITGFGDGTGTDGSTTMGTSASAGSSGSTSVPTTDTDPTAGTGDGTDTEPPAGDGEEEGCGCTTGSNSPVPAWLYLLALPAFRRRRRATRTRAA